jgi:hypothetical protein
MFLLIPLILLLTCRRVQCHYMGSFGSLFLLFQCSILPSLHLCIISSSHAVSIFQFLKTRVRLSADSISHIFLHTEYLITASHI